jgi:hypothetical protein
MVAETTKATMDLRRRRTWYRSRWDIRDGLREPQSSGGARPAGFRVVGLFVRLVESEASDAIADHDNSDHEQNHDHDRHIVLHQPLP